MDVSSYIKVKKAFFFTYIDYIEAITDLQIDSNILVLGAAQTVFECAMYIFVLLYTPAIENADNTEGLFIIDT